MILDYLIFIINSYRVIDKPKLFKKKMLVVLHDILLRKFSYCYRTMEYSNAYEKAAMFVMPNVRIVEWWNRIRDSELDQP